MASEFRDDFDLQKISIQSTYSGIGGFTMSGPSKKWTEDGMHTKAFLEKRIQILLGGRACEEVFYGTEFVSLGARNDLKEANGLAKEMVEELGMTDANSGVYARTDRGSSRNPTGMGDSISEWKKSELEREAFHIIDQAYERTVASIARNRGLIDRVAERLMTERVIIGDPFLEDAMANPISTGTAAITDAGDVTGVVNNSTSITPANGTKL
jgi:cell division protease FtsH